MSASRNPWRPIKTYRGNEFRRVDLWVRIYQSPRSFGMSDAFRVTDAWRQDSKWFHSHEGHKTELNADYVTHWMPLPRPPRKRA